MADENRTSTTNESSGTTNENGIALDAESIWQEYTGSIEYDNGIEFDEEVKENRQFYIGNQWDGVNSGNLQKPVLNVVHLVGSHHIASIQSNDVSAVVTPFLSTDETMRLMAKVVASEIDKQVELSRTKEKFRDTIQDGYVDGNSCMYLYSEINSSTDQLYKASIQTEVLDCTQVFFGNPYDKNVQSQPWIIIAQRLYLEDVKKTALDNGVDQSTVDSMQADDDQTQMNEDTTKSVLKTVLTKFYKVRNGENVSVHWLQTTQEAVIREDTDLQYTMYPIVYTQWEDRNKYTYRGISPITYIKPNQIMINKILALMLYYCQNMAFPYVLADKTKLRLIIDSLTSGDNTGTQVITTPNIELTGQVMDFLKVPDFSGQVNNTLEVLYERTKECMGISDANLGNLRPENTSAIIALQEATMLPLQVQIRNYNDAYEQIARIMVDIMAHDYGTRDVEVSMNGETQIMSFNFNDLQEANLNISMEVGASTYWSETSQITTMDNMLAKGLITNPIDYLERIPDKYIPNKAGLIDTLRQAQQQALAMSGQQVATNAALDGDYASAEALAQLQTSGNELQTTVQPY